MDDARRRVPLEDTVFKKLLIAVVIFGCLGLAGFGVLAWEPAIAPTSDPFKDEAGN